MISSQLDDGEFARLLYEKIRDLIGRAFTVSLERAIAVGDAMPVGREPLNLFWFAHHTVLMMVLTQLPAVPALSYGTAPGLERQICEFILRGVGLNSAAIALHLDREPVFNAAHTSAVESA
jgi:hypothetical protein